MKKYYLMDGIGTVKYTVNFHDGVKTHLDGSEFWDIRCFNIKKNRDLFVAELIKQNYITR
jgi:hypothetical protein